MLPVAVLPVAVLPVAVLPVAVQPCNQFQSNRKITLYDSLSYTKIKSIVDQWSLVTRLLPNHA